MVIRPNPMRVVSFGRQAKHDPEVRQRLLELVRRRGSLEMCHDVLARIFRQLGVGSLVAEPVVIGI